jgi:L-lactate utilization protein LutB
VTNPPFASVPSSKREAEAAPPSGDIVSTPPPERTERTIESLRANGFRVHFVRDAQEARDLFLTEILPRVRPRSVSWGDSLTLRALELLPDLETRKDLEFIRTFGSDLSEAERTENRRRALSCELFLTGTNAITARGQLVNLDMTGNRVAGIAFGPHKVVLFVGTNKIVEDPGEAMERIRSVAAPLNAKRHRDFGTPCAATGICVDCRSPRRICNTWTITEKSYPRERIEIVLIDEKLGY